MFVTFAVKSFSC